MPTAGPARLYQIRTEPVWAGSPAPPLPPSVATGAIAPERARFSPARLYQIKAEPPFVPSSPPSPPPPSAPHFGNANIERARFQPARLYQIKAEPPFVPPTVLPPARGPGDPPAERARFTPARLYQIKTEPVFVPSKARSAPAPQTAGRLCWPPSWLTPKDIEELNRMDAPQQMTKEELIQLLHRGIDNEGRSAAGAKYAVAALQHRTREALLRELLDLIERLGAPGSSDT